MVNTENLLKVKGKEICIILKYGDYMSVCGILLDIQNEEIILECRDNSTYGNASVLDSEAHIPISSLASWFLLKESERLN
jgi:hypothetical protein